MPSLTQVHQQQGFAQLNGTGLGVLEGFLGYGEHDDSAVDNNWVTPCPAGSRVDGYQVVHGPLLIQIRPRCSCYNCGAPAVPPCADLLTPAAACQGASAGPRCRRMVDGPVQPLGRLRSLPDLHVQPPACARRVPVPA